MGILRLILGYKVDHKQSELEWCVKILFTHISCSMITESFYEKADLEQWLKSDIHREDYKDLTDKLWEPLVQKNLSFLVKDMCGQPVAVALNFDAHDEPSVQIVSKLVVVFDFLEFLEGPVRYCRLKKVHKIFCTVKKSYKISYLVHLL